MQYGMMRGGTCEVVKHLYLGHYHMIKRSLLLGA